MRYVPAVGTGRMILLAGGISAFAAPFVGIGGHGDTELISLSVAMVLLRDASPSIAIGLFAYWAVSAVVVAVLLRHVFPGALQATRGKDNAV